MSTRAGVNWISTLGSALGIPAAQGADVVGGDVRAVLGTQEVLQQDLQAERQAVVPVHRADPVDLVARVTDAQLALRTEGVQARHVYSLVASRVVAVVGSILPRNGRRCAGFKQTVRPSCYFVKPGPHPVPGRR